MFDMTVKDIKKALENVPDDYVVCSRSNNAHLGDDVQFARKVGQIRVLKEKKAVMFIGGWE